MSVGMTILLALLVFAALLAAQMPVAVGLAAAGAVGLLLAGGVEQTAGTLASAAYQATSTYALVVIPMFILMGVLVANAGVLQDLFSLAHRLTRKFPGGLGVATVLSAAGFSAVTGSSAAAVATLGRLCVGEMRKHGYRIRMAAGIVAASGTLGILIPPSVVLVIYGVLTQESIGQLLLGAIVPGILTAVAYIVTIVVLVLTDRARSTHRVPEPATVGGSMPPATGTPTTVTAEPPRSNPSRLREYEALGYIVVIFVVVMGGIYTGVFTETEAGAVGALAALLVLLVRSRRTENGVRRAFAGAVRETSAITSMTFALLIGGSIFTLFLVTERVPVMLADWVTGLDVAGWVVIVIFLLVLLMLGALLDGVSILLLTMPLAYPLVIELGYSGVWFGIIAVKMVEIGLLTPPFGLNAYVVAGVVDDVTVEDAFRGVVPFIVTELILVGILFAFPELVTWLPSLMAQ
ncbi:TRAP transporter large permease [Pseudonocardia parietis]|uniref:Tripartite ATP-independent transporter DctM subunit n=1 Tax=Pseudonocardia parietis TaxID=570936 RepID=A0ABS4VQK0_9PSEU|nr:TRAP transporter large permease [Pseudonocardia parietis]MBP2366177.1 tripartite ATP-independent transporter DctM subunit [Pseudonocardia parietis]